MRFGFPRRRTWLTATLAAIGAFALVAAACGDDDDDDDGEIRTGSAEDYVEAFCEAQNDFFGDLLGAALELDEDASDEEVLEAFEEPLRNALDAIRDARPPEGAVEYHRTLVAAFSDVVDAVEDGDVNALDDDPFADIDVSELPEETRAELSSLAEESEACNDGLAGNPFEES